MSTHGDLSEADRNAIAARAESIIDTAELAHLVVNGSDIDTLATYAGRSTDDMKRVLTRCLSRDERATTDPLLMVQMRAQDPGYDLPARLQSAMNQPARQNTYWDRPQCDHLIRLVMASDNITKDVHAIAAQLGRSTRSICKQARTMIPEEHAKLKGLAPVRMLWQILQNDPSYASHYRVQKSVLEIDAITRAIEAHAPIDVVISETGLTEDQVLNKTIRVTDATNHDEAAALYRAPARTTPPQHRSTNVIRNAIRRLTGNTKSQ